MDNGGTGNYNGLSVKLTKRYSSGLTYLFGYTWSKTLDTGSAIRTHDGDTLFPQNSGCRACEYGLSSFHMAHRLVTSDAVRSSVREGPACITSRIRC